SVLVDPRVAGEHAYVLGAEDVAQGEELLADQGFDRRGVEGHLVTGERRQVGTDRHQALAGAGGRTQDHVGAGDDLDHRLLLGRVEGETLALGVLLEGLVNDCRIVGVRDNHRSPRLSRSCCSQIPIAATAMNASAAQTSSLKIALTSCGVAGLDGGSDRSLSPVVGWDESRPRCYSPVKEDG